MNELSAEAVEQALTTRRLGRPLLFFERAGSTNDALREAAAGGAPEGMLALAEEQTAGRGREGRSWWAPPGTCLLMSLLLRPDLPPMRAGQTTMCLGLGASDGIYDATGLRVGLKWPNDLLISRRKLGGMLTEMDAQGNRLNWVVLGLGLNVNLVVKGADIPGVPRVTAPADVAPLAMSLAMALGRRVDRMALLVAILAATERWYEQLLGGQSLHEIWARRLDTLGQIVQVSFPGGSTLSGRAEGVDPQGALLVRSADGNVHTVWAGDVLTLRGHPQDKEG